MTVLRQPPDSCALNVNVNVSAIFYKKKKIWKNLCYFNYFASKKYPIKEKSKGNRT